MVWLLSSRRCSSGRAIPSAAPVTHWLRRARSIRGSEPSCPVVAAPPRSGQAGQSLFGLPSGSGATDAELLDTETWGHLLQQTLRREAAGRRGRYAPGHGGAPSAASAGDQASRRSPPRSRPSWSPRREAAEAVAAVEAHRLDRGRRGRGRHRDRAFGWSTVSCSSARRPGRPGGATRTPPESTPRPSACTGVVGVRRARGGAHRRRSGLRRAAPGAGPATRWPTVRPPQQTHARQRTTLILVGLSVVSVVVALLTVPAVWWFAGGTIAAGRLPDLPAPPGPARRACVAAASTHASCRWAWSRARTTSCRCAAAPASPGAVVLEIDDEDPAFDVLDTYDRDPTPATTATPSAAAWPLRRAVG